MIIIQYRSGPQNTKYSDEKVYKLSRAILKIAKIYMGYLDYYHVSFLKIWNFVNSSALKT